MLTATDVSSHFLVLIMRLSNTDNIINYILYYMLANIIVLQNTFYHYLYNDIFYSASYSL